MLIIIRLICILLPFFPFFSHLFSLISLSSITVSSPTIIFYTTSALSKAPLEEFRQYSWKWGSKFLLTGTSSARLSPLTLKPFIVKEQIGTVSFFHFYGRNWEMDEGGTRTHFENTFCLCFFVSLSLYAVNFLLLIFLPHVSSSSHLKSETDPAENYEFRFWYMKSAVLADYLNRDDVWEEDGK